MSFESLGSTNTFQWLANLGTEQNTENKHFLRKTSIIATIGPKVNNVESLTNLREAGMNIVRMNFSHGSYEYHQSVIDNVRTAVAGMSLSSHLFLLPNTPQQTQTTDHSLLLWTLRVQRSVPV